MPFYIKVHPTTVERRRAVGIDDPFYGYADNRDILAYLNDERDAHMPPLKDKLPMNFHGEYGPIPLKDGRTTVLRVDFGTPSSTGDWRGKSSKHRVFAVCPDCNAEVPAGRTHQHKCKGGK